MRFEVLVSDQFVVLKNDVGSLWWKRVQRSATGDSDKQARIDFKVTASKPEFRLIKDNGCWDEFTCHGLAYGLVGLFQDDKLILIKQSTPVGRLPFGSQEEVFKIQKICVVPLQTKGDPLEYLGLDKCSQDTCTKPLVIIPSPNEPCMSASFKDSIIEETSLKIQSSAAGTATSGMQKTWNQIKLTASNVKPQVRNKLNMITSSSLGTTASGGTGGGQPNRMDEKERIERRFVEELYKMFNETHSFYYSWRGDLTNSVQRQYKQKASFKIEGGDKKQYLVPLWKRVDERFFWNYHMLRAVIQVFQTTEDSQDVLSYSHTWVLPIVQGFVQIEKCYFDPTDIVPVGSNLSQTTTGDENMPTIRTTDKIEGRDYYLMTLISRRSRYRAGTRYKKRGLDDNGKCANYVETEQIFTYASHTVAFVCVRGSVPLYWSQVGHKYRPPPRLERSEEENTQAFSKHFEEEFGIYDNNVVIVNLIERTGREKILNDAFLDGVIRFDDSRLTFVSFDFHDQCRGMRFENVSILMNKIYELVKEKRYCWVNGDDMICEQEGVFRINCVDCLDRTNIVMTAIAKAVMDIQLIRLSLLPPEGQLPSNSRRIFQLMWAHNGDIISRQYAGTAALKGDYTRTGERKISGVMRDGYNSANRYYLNRFRDAYRQAVIDIMQGNPVCESLVSPENEKSKSSLTAPASNLPSSSSNSSLSSNDPEYHERIKLVIEDCKKILVPEEEIILGGWPLVDADPVTGTPLTSARVIGELVEAEMDIVLILTKDCYYVADYDDQTDRIVKYQKVLLEDLEKIELGAEPNLSNVPFGSIRNSQNSRIVSYAVRFHYIIDGQSGYFHMFRSTSTRFFNNMAIPIRTREEALESLKAICESFRVALSVKSLNVPFLEIGRLERRKSKRLYSSSFKFDNSSSSGKTINSGGQAGGNSSKILNGVYSHLSKLRGKLAGGLVGGSLLEPSKVPSLPESGQEEFEATTPTGDDDGEEDEESDEDDSLQKLRKKRFNRSSLTTNNSSSSSLVVERSLSSDMSEGSDFDDSELMLPPISELGSPGGDDGNLKGTKEHMDRVLESCGILVTSPPLRQTPPLSETDGRMNRSMMGPRPANPSPTSSGKELKSVLHDVDDFVLDSMKKASLRQIHRKAASQISLSASSNSISNQDYPKIQIDQSDRDSMGSHGSSARCFYSSELALNSIVSASIKKDPYCKLSNSYSTDALDSGETSGTSKNDGDQLNLAFQCGGAYPLLSSSSFAALSFQDEVDLTSLDNQSMSLNILPEDYLSVCHGGQHLGVGSKESSLSVCNLFGGHPNLKTSLSSNALQSSVSGTMSLNLPIVNSSSVLTITDELESSSSHIPASSTSSGSNFTSSLMVKKDLVFTPLSRIARGMQSLTANLRSSGGESSNDSASQAFNAELDKRKGQTKSRLIFI